MQAEHAHRIQSVDVVRGAVMVVMALDHVRDFVTELRFPPENLARGTTALFLTRWVTHFCAPAFFLLAGVGIGLAMQRGKTVARMSRFLVTRGLWLVVLDLTISAIGWQFGFKLVPAFALVIWALGWSMVIMAAVIWAPKSAILAGALLVIGAHDLLDNVQPQDLGAWSGVWMVLHQPGFAVAGKLFVAYPLVPWFGVMALGFVLAQTYRWDAGRRRRVLVWCGVAAVILFVVLRALHAYGDSFPYAPQRTPGLTVASFLDARKYPPSLQFLLMTLGPILVALALAETARGRIASWLVVYGRVPLFFYVVHIYVVHALGVIVALVQGGELRRIPVVTDPGSLPDWYGLSLPGVYVAWAIVVALAYYPCRWFGRLKAERRDGWLSYL